MRTVHDCTRLYKTEQDCTRLETGQGLPHAQEPGLGGDLVAEGRADLGSRKGQAVVVELVEALHDGGKGQSIIPRGWER